MFPNVKFEHMSGYKTAPNMSTYNLRWYQGRYVMGQIAAKVSKTGIAGYIVSFPIPEVVMGIDAFMLGAQIGQSGLQGQDHLDQYLARSRQGGRCRQDAGRSGRRHSGAAHQLAGSDADRRAA